ncbi:LOW QUALITY PROTEIN: transmembrane protein 150C [Dunckerocampus dactyliophorus]|uniref:LOW QUALITY PROTEIN: transmembrane protein 150C n=1 Tax=Dunckerocampus dactyliophorus TaxID=161453 RepID=UPI0024068F90|nr:LOW QUALITY PROTEIN: transmembrane protein 150C [Dunckerocampus dactyliophorus]
MRTLSWWGLLPPFFTLSTTASGLWLVYYVAVQERRILLLTSNHWVWLPLQMFTAEGVHILGTAMTFGLGGVYCWLQSYITLRANLNGEGEKVGAMRFLLSACITVCMILCILQLLHFFLHLYLFLHAHQWTLVMLFLVFIGTFAVEFRHTRFYLLCTKTPGSPAALRHQHDRLIQRQETL